MFVLTYKIFVFFLIDLIQKTIDRIRTIRVPCRMPLFVILGGGGED